MDPFSIATGILSVLQASGAILELCNHIRTALRKVPWSVMRITEEVRDLRGIVEAIQSGLDNFDDPNDEIARSFCRAIDQPILAVIAELAALERRLQRVPIEDLVESKWKSLKHAFVWEFEEQETKEWIDRLERCKSSLNLAITSQNSTSLRNLERATISFNTSLQETCSRLDDVARILYKFENDERGKNLIQWISPSNSTPWESHAAALKLHQEGTSKWLENSVEYSNWLAGKYPICWLSGPPGSGKTVLFAYTVQNFSNQVAKTRSNWSNLFAFTYCDFRKDGIINPQTVDTLLGSLLAQLCVQTGDYPDRILREYKMSTQNINNHVRTTSLKSQIIIESLLDLARKNHITLFVDALDETDDMDDLLEALETLTSSSENIRVFLTSRSDAQIRERFPAKCVQIDLANRIVEMDRDIGVYIENRLQSDRRLAWSNSGISKDISQTLQSQSFGMFRWAQCQLDSIARARTIKEIRRALTTLPKGLDETYNRILLQVPSSDQDVLYKALVWLAFSFIPLSLEELWEAVAIDPGSSSIDEESRLRSPQDLLSLGHSLICVASDGQARLTHASVRDYLLSTPVRQCPDLSKFALNSAKAHRQLAHASLSYLCFDEFKQGPCMSNEEYRARIKNHPLARHAAIVWSYHLRSAIQLEAPSGPPSADWNRFQQLSLDFFCPNSIRPQFLSWVQIINADSPFKWDVYPRHATPLYYASSFGFTAIVEHILQVTSASPTPTTTAINSPGSTFGGTALHAATIRNHLQIMDLLLAAGANPGKADFHDVTPLHSAASQGNMTTIRILLKHNAPPTARDGLSGKTPAEWAAMSGEEEVARFLGSLQTATVCTLSTCTIESSEEKDEKKDQGISSSPPECNNYRRAAPPLSLPRRSDSDPTSHCHHYQQISNQPLPSTSSISTSRRASFSRHGDNSKNNKTDMAEPEQVSLWRPGQREFFPDVYDKRSGLCSSILVGFGSGGKETAVEPSFSPVLHSRASSWG